MVWNHSGFKHWTSINIKGLMIDVRIVKNISYYSVIDDETGEVLRTEEFNHPLDAMAKAETEVVGNAI